MTTRLTSLGSTVIWSGNRLTLSSLGATVLFQSAVLQLTSLGVTVMFEPAAAAGGTMMRFTVSD